MKIKNPLTQCLLAALVWLSGIFITQANAMETVTYYHTDGLGSVIAASDSTGSIIWKEAYKPYGDRIIRPATDNGTWYTGHVEDKDTGLTYMGARWYDPMLGRFMGVDPAGVNLISSGGFNLYVYANNSPYRYMDPDGREGIDTLYMDDNAPLIVAGRAFGDLAAFVVGLSTGDQQMVDESVQHMAEQEHVNRETVIILATMGRGKGVANKGVYEGTARAWKDGAKPNSIYIQKTADGKTKSISYYDETGKQFSREDYIQNAKHNVSVDGQRYNLKNYPHEHQIRQIEGPNGPYFKKQVRILDENGKPITGWTNEK